VDRRKAILLAVHNPLKTPVAEKLGAVGLHDLRRGEVAVIARVESLPIEATGDAREVLQSRLRDLGFIPGARCEIVARMWPAGDPIAVRIGGSTFALRRSEAAAIQVYRLEERAVVPAFA
jgi:ferrous iron transport protein A